MDQDWIIGRDGLIAETGTDRGDTEKAGRRLSAFGEAVGKMTEPQLADSRSRQEKEESHD